MSNYKQTNSGILIPNTKPKAAIQLNIAHCGTCPRIILKQREPHGEYVIINGKPMCPVCRVTKRGKMKEQILSSTDRAVKDVEDAKIHKRKLESDRIGDIAADSGRNFLKNITQ